MSSFSTGYPERRLKMVAVGFQLLIDLCTQSPTPPKLITPLFLPECVAGLPEGALVVGSAIDHDRMEAHLIFYHSSFSLVPEGADPPFLEVRFENRTRVQPFPGLTLEVLSPGALTVTREASLVEGKYIRPDEREYTVDYETQDGQIIRQQIRELVDSVEYTSRDMSLRERVATSRKLSK